MPSMFGTEVRNNFEMLLRDKLAVSEMLSEALLLSVTEEFLAKNPDFGKNMTTMTENPLPAHVWRHYAQAQFNHDTRDRLPDIKAPAFVIHGEEDRVVLVENARIMASRIPGAELVVFENTGHMLVEAETKPREVSLDLLRRHSLSNKGGSME